jgi:hypothetical protein
MKYYKRLFAPISVILLVVVAGLAFLNVRPSYVGPPPILDPSFQLWIGDPTSRRPMLWDFEYVNASGSSVSLNEVVINGKKAVELLIASTGRGDDPSYAYLKQTMDGQRLVDLLSYDVGVWVLTEPCNCNETITTNSVVFGIEVNDGIHTLTFIFSESAAQATILAHRFVYLPTRPATWVYQHINVTEQYQLAHWALPELLTFSLVFEVGGRATGSHSAFVNSFQATRPPVRIRSQGSSQAKQSALLFNNPRWRTLVRLKFSCFVAKV